MLSATAMTCIHFLLIRSLLETKSLYRGIEICNILNPTHLEKGALILVPAKAVILAIFAVINPTIFLISRKAKQLSPQAGLNVLFMRSQKSEHIL